MSQTKITKMDVVTPPVFQGSEEDRWALPRNEGAEIVLHFSPDDFARVKADIKEIPLLGINESLYLTGDNGDDWSYKGTTPEQVAQGLTQKLFSIGLQGTKLDSPATVQALMSGADETRGEARKKWQAMLDREATLAQEDGFVINAAIGREPNTIVISKLQEEPRGEFVWRNNEYGSRGTRAFNASDIQRISYGVENMLGVVVPPTFERELETGIARAQPKHGHAPRGRIDVILQRGNERGEYSDLPGTNYSASFAR